MTAEDKTNEEAANERLNQRNLSIQGNVDDSNIVVGDRNVINQGPSYYTTNVFGTFETEQFSVRPSQQLSKDEYRWRQVLVQNVKRYWIEGVLEKSLHNQALIELGLEERAQAVASPIGAAEEFVEGSGQPFPAGTHATDIFDGLGAGRTLLILGEPGAGKTTMLLKLTKTLIARIGDDFSQPIPVVLNLSSWATERQPIAEWLVQALHKTLHASKSLGTTWIKEEQLTLCLDGLDEVAAEHRNACLQALNQFLQSHGRTEVVVCSRIRDYEALSERLKAKCAIYVQPLTEQQIDQYLEQAGEQLLALGQVFNRSSEIKAFAASPLTLSVMSLACQGRSFQKFSDVDSAQDFRQQLFDTYIERMFLRRCSIHGYPKSLSKRWLKWMAQQMKDTSQTVFLVEQLQPSLLNNRAKRLQYRLESSLTLGAIVGLLSGLMVGLINLQDDNIIERLTATRNAVLVFGLVTSLITACLQDIRPMEKLIWSWKGKKYFLVAVLISSLLGGPIGIPVAVLVSGLSSSEVQKRDTPNQGIWQSVRNACLIALCAGLLACFLVLLFSRFLMPASGFQYMVKYLLTMFFPTGLIVGLIGGGSACLRHFSLRWMLYRMRYTPWNYARFLNYATERLFLQKVGGGYIFIHRMLLEHFAQMEIEQTPLK
ncbi:MAG: NACHT domain-containing protein [Cyanobacteria bacterium J06650_10]